MNHPSTHPIRHSVCKWCYGDIPLDSFCQTAKSLGIEGIDILDLDTAPTLQKQGLVNSMISGVPGGIEKGLNRLENHDSIIEFFEWAIPQAARLNYPNFVCFSGNRDGMDDEEGLRNCATGLKKIAPIAEKHGITIALELLNSKVNHQDYMADSTQWGIDLCDAVTSENIKLLYDIYHMQIMEGDIIATIKKHHPYFAHYHTAGVPGRHEIDETQELNYPAIVAAIQETGYRGFLGQEFIPISDDPIESLKKSITRCTV